MDSNTNNIDVQDTLEKTSTQENNKTVENTNKNIKKKKKKIGKLVFNIITFILFILILVDAIIGIVNMQRINNNEEPVWYLSTNVTETELKTVTEYHLGLYKIVKTDSAKETKITLKPFFIGE